MILAFWRMKGGRKGREPCFCLLPSSDWGQQSNLRPGETYVDERHIDVVDAVVDILNLLVSAHCCTEPAKSAGEETRFLISSLTK